MRLQKKYKKSKEKNYVPEKIKLDERGKAHEEAEKFSDRSILGDLYTIKINKLKIWSDDTCIKGIQAWYNNHVTREIIEAPQHLVEGSSFTISNYDLPLNDYVKTIGGSIGNSGLIETLYVVSSNGKTGRYGVEKKGQKHFELDIGTDQIPITLSGAIIQSNQKKSDSGWEIYSLYIFYIII